MNNGTDYNFVGWLLVILGWGFLIWNSNRIAKRQDIRSTFNTINEILKEIFSELIDLSNSDKDFSAIEISVSGKISSIEFRCELIQDLTAQAVLNLELLASLRDIPFDEISDSRKQSDPQLLVVSENISQCTEILERCYQRIYQKTEFWAGLKHNLSPTALGVMFALVCIYIVVDAGFHITSRFFGY